MPSADFCVRIPTPLDVGSTTARTQLSPGIAHPPSRLCLSDLRRSLPYKFRALMIMAISPDCVASYPLPVRQASALPSASSRFPVTQNTLAVQLTLPLAGRVEDFHLQVSAPCRAHQKKAPLDGGAMGGGRWSAMPGAGRVSPPAARQAARCQGRPRTPGRHPRI